jgi:Tol biopolymer transport system component
MRDTEQRLYYQPRLSPDARQLAITVAGGNDDIWVYHLETEVLSRFTAGANYSFPSWTPDGDRLAFYQSDTQELLWQRADRTTLPEVLLAADGVVPHSWSPDGGLLALTEPGNGTGLDLWLLRVNDRHKRPLIVSRFSEVAPMISPDGRWLAYTSDESGRHEVYVVPFPDGGARVQVSREGGTEPQWSKDGLELFFRHDEKLMAVETQPQFGKPAEMFEAPWWTTRFPSRTTYDVFPGGQRFVLLRSNVSTDNPRIHVIVNWAADLK